MEENHPEDCDLSNEYQKLGEPCSNIEDDSNEEQEKILEEKDESKKRKQPKPVDQ